MDKQSYQIFLHTLRQKSQRNDQQLNIQREKLDPFMVPSLGKKMLINVDDFVRTVEPCDLILFR